jgi:hypothetical protein
MADDHDDRLRPGVYDDDRLLACALGLEEDPELLAAAAADPALGARLDAMRADVADVGASIAAAVPAPQEEYADLSGDRWDGLREFFETPAGATKPNQRRRWWRVVAPAAALVILALVVGIVAVNGGGVTGSGSTSSEVARSVGEGGAPVPTYGSTDATEGGTGATTAPTIGERFADEMQRFAVVVLARARQVTGAVQRFAVLRIFKGEAPKVVELVVDDRPADRGRLHLLMLDPTTPSATGTGSPWPLSQSPEELGGSPLPETVSPELQDESPEPFPSQPAADGGPGVPLAVSYTYHGTPVMVREFAAGTDPHSVTITSP